MAAYTALVSLSQTTLVSINEDANLFSIHSKEKLRSIHEYVMFMLSFLEDFPQKAMRWEGRVRDVAHKIEDIILWQQMHSRHISTIPPGMEFRNQLNEVTEEIGLIAGQMMEDRPAYLPTVVKSSSPSATPATTSNNAVIGFEKDQMAIKERLCGQSSTLQVVPIVGMAGIGKTTLATTIYKDPLILEHFEVRAWLTVSQDYNEHRILLGLLDSLRFLEEQRCGKNIDESEVEEVELCANLKEQVSREEIGESETATKIYHILKWRRYLIVMDDVWSQEVWDDLMSIFPDDNNGSRIMLTTRLMDLAAYSNPNSHFYDLILYDLYMLPHPPDELDHPLENLQTLLPLENLVWNEKMVRMIPNVKKLGLVNTLNQGYQLHHLNHLHQLEKLQVNGYRKFSWLAQVRTFPRTLKKLTLVGGGFPWADMSIIGSLPNLQVLKLRNRACDGVTWEITDDEFPELKYLLIHNSVLEQWVTQGSPFPRLQQLVISSCWRLGKIPEGIGEISTLELIEVVGYSRSTLMKSVKQIKHHQQSFGDDALQIRAISHINSFERAGSRYNDISLMSAAQHCRQFSFKEICSSIGYFSDTYLLGSSNRGKVYRGFIDDGSVTVAIKRLSSNLNKGETELQQGWKH